MLAACGGGGASLTPASHGGGQQTPTGRSVAVQFTIVLPQRTGSSAVRRPRYVSASTKSATVSVAPATGGSPSAPTTIGCSATTCSGQVSAPVGSDIFTVKLFDQAAGAGNLLSTGTLTQTIVLDQANVVNVTFNGVVHSLAISLAPAAVTFGKASTVQVVFAALDADGNTIVGPGSYVDASGNPLTVTLADSDTSGTTSLSTHTLTAPPATPVTLAYNGAAIGCITISAAAHALATASTLLPATGPTTLYVAGTTTPGGATTEIEAILNPATAPSLTRTIAGAATDLSGGVNDIATDACTNLLATTKSATVAQQVLVFGSTSNGNVAPTRTFGDPNNGPPTAITVDPANEPTISYGSQFVPQNEDVEIFSPTASGSTAPLRTISAAYIGADALTYDPRGDLWDAVQEIYVASATATRLPVNPTILGNVEDELYGISSTTVDPSGNLYAANVVNTASGLSNITYSWILQFAHGANGYPVPTRVLYPPSVSTSLLDVENLSTDSTGKLYALEDVDNAIEMVEYAAAPSTNSSPIATFSVGPAFSTAVASDGTIYSVDDTGFVRIFAPGNTTGTPTATLQATVPSGGASWYVGVAPDKTLYIGFYSGTQPSLTFSFDVYAPGVTGTAAPLRTLSGPTGEFPQYSATVDTSGNLYLALANATGASTVTVYPAGATSSNRTFTVPLIGGAHPSFDPTSGNLDVASTYLGYSLVDFEPAEIQGFPASSTGTAVPAVQIRSGAPAGMPDDAEQIGHDASGDIYVECYGDGSVRVYDPTTLTLVRSILGLPVVGPMAVDIDGTVYIAGSGETSDANLDAKRRAARSIRRPLQTTTADYGAILVYGPSASGLVAPTSVIPASTLGITPTSLAVTH
jgi:hypothetical protein